MQVHLSLINQFLIKVDNVEVRRLRTRKTEELLAYLVIHVGLWRSRTELIDLLWPEADEQTGRRKLRLAIHSIRSVVGNHLESDGDLVRVCDVDLDFREDNILNLGSGWRLMPEHRIDWLDLMVASTHAQHQIDAVTTISSPTNSSDRATQLNYLIAVEPLEPSLYLALYNHYLESGRGIAASVVAGIARQNLGGNCPNEFLDVPSSFFRSDFCGRLRELTFLADQVLGPNEPAMVQINGLGGLGKTRLAQEIALLAPLEDIPVAQVNLNGFDEAEGICRSAISAALGMDQDEVSDPQNIPSMLLILDNADSLKPKALDFLLPFLSQGCGLRILITSQQRREEFGISLSLVPLGLPVGDSLAQVQLSASVQLLLFHSGQSLTEANCSAFLTIANASSGIPLAIRMIGSQCRIRSVVDVAREVLEANYDFKFNSIGESQSPRHMSINATLKWGFDLLSDEARESIIRLAYLEDEFDRRIGEPLKISAKVFDHLLESSWLTIRESNLIILPPVRQFLREQDPNMELESRDKIKTFLIDSITVNYPENSALVTSIAEIYHMDIAHYEGCAGSVKDRGALLIGLQITAHRYGRVEYFLQRMSEAVELLPNPIWMNQLGATFYLQKDYARARECFEVVVRDSDKENQSIANSNIALIYLATGEIEKSIPLMRESIDATTNQRRRATRILNLGSALLAAGEFSEARTCCIKALEQFTNMDNLPGFVGLSHLRLAEVELVAGNWNQAEREALIALEFWESLKQWPHLNDTYVVLVLLAALRGDVSDFREWLEKWLKHSVPPMTLCTALYVALEIMGRSNLANLFGSCLARSQAPLLVLTLARRHNIVLTVEPKQKISRSDAVALARQTMKRL